MYRVRIDSFNELSKDKRPPRNLWDKPHRLDEFIDHIFDRTDDTNSKKSTYVTFDPEDLE